ncbi:MAG: ABC transporter ATP-binding protein [Lachnospiraceae bacterium]|nr:ABC transporter ATP-binding protein [Lachnospiraceae bacterium]
MIEIDNIFAGYGKCEILHGVSLFVPAGKITTLIGANGSGKSTLLKALLHFLPLTSGEIRVGGVPIDKFSRTDLAKKIAYLPQSKTVPDITAERLVLHGRFPYLNYPRKYRKEDIAIAREAMEQMGILEFSDRLMAELSGGVRQKVYIAMALAQQAEIIVMDEPTTYLDIGQQVKFSKLVHQLSINGKTLLLVLHDLPLALRLSDQVASICDGKIFAAGTPAQILESGIIQTLYGVTVRFVELASGIQYFYD